MDTLVVGQDVRLISGCYYLQGKVVEVTRAGVKVETQQGELSFGHNGAGHQSTYECGAWYILGTQPYPEVEMSA